MKWADLLRIVGDEPIFHSSVLMSGSVDSVDARRQLCRWVRSGNLIQVRKGLYALNERYRKTTPHPFLVANRMKRASYVSLQSALEYYGLIPEYVPKVTSVTTGRPETVSTSLGEYIFKHIKTDWFSGYRQIDVGDGQSAFVASPEKALLDLLYLTPGSDERNFLRELRLQNMEGIDIDLLGELAERSNSRKLARSVPKIATLTKEETSERS